MNAMKKIEGGRYRYFVAGGRCIGPEREAADSDSVLVAVRFAAPGRRRQQRVVGVEGPAYVV